jgi:hypothetical protein
LKKILVHYKTPGGIIWKVLPDENGNYMAVESRDGEKRNTMLSVVNLFDNNFLFTIDRLPKPWWLSLKAVGYGKIILQGYKESNNPETKGLYVFDLLTGKLLWQEEEELFYSFSDNETMLLSFVKEDQETFQKVVSASGKIIEEVVTIEEKENVATQTSSVFPLLYTEDNIHYKTIADFLYQNYEYKSVGPLEYLEYRTNMLVSFYIRENKKLTNILLVIEEEGNCLLQDTLMEGADGIGMSSFFVCRNKLIYIKNKVSIALAELL